MSSTSSTSVSSVHHRRPYMYSNNSNSDKNETNNSTTMSMSNSSPSPSHSPTIKSSTLLKSNPTHHQKVYKLKIPTIYKIAPPFVISILQVLCFPLALLGMTLRFKPYWVERYFILLGDYLYKFKPKNSNNGNTDAAAGNNKMIIKGSPIPLNAMTVSSLTQLSPYVVGHDGNDHHFFDTVDVVIPTHPQCNGYFSITSSYSSSKTNYYATQTQSDSHTWINILHHAKQESITAQMGHSRKPTSKDVEYCNRLGKNMVERNARVKELLRKKELEEVELVCRGAGGYLG